VKLCADGRWGAKLCAEAKIRCFWGRFDFFKSTFEHIKAVAEVSFEFINLRGLLQLCLSQVFLLLENALFCFRRIGRRKALSVLGGLRWRSPCCAIPIIVLERIDMSSVQWAFRRVGGACL
jgi:hypothetical protein